MSMDLLSLIKRAVTKDFAPGLPDPERFGDVRELIKHKLIPWVVQEHEAQRAGRHLDVRMGQDDLYSWATKKELPGPGEKILLHQQPLHKGSYGDFEGVITKGYGKGTVRTFDKGRIIVTKAEPDQINFTVAHHKFPENFTLLRVGGPPSSAMKTARGRATQGGTWLMVNTTPRDAAKLLGGKPEEVGLKKLRYATVPADEVEKVFDGNYLVQEKIDGASSLFHLLSDRIEALSYRTSKTGQPIVHTYRVFGPSGGKVFTKPIPKELVGTILKGELYGVRDGEVIPPQELGGLLNASVVNSLESQKKNRVQLKGMLFDVVREGKKPIPELSITPEERMKKLEEISKFMPKGKFRLPETAYTPEEARGLFERIRLGEHPRTSEGIVAWPKEPGKLPRKIKVLPEADVFVRKIFPGLGKLEGTGAGGFEYSRSPEGPIVGRVGTGFTEQTRKEMLEDPESWIGRIARIRSQGDFPRTGAFRAPAFIGFHEDYSMKTAALKPEVELLPHQKRVIEKIKQEPAVLVFHGLGSGKTLASIAAGEEFPGKKEVIVPASLRENYAKELKKFLKGSPAAYNIKSYQKAIEEPPDPEAALTIFDEAHRMGRAGTQTSVLAGKAPGKTLLLSGTPLRNEPGEIAPLLRAIARDRDAPESVKMFNTQFIGERELPQGFWEKVFNVPPSTEQFLRNKQKLKGILAGRIDYHPAVGEYPERINERIEVDMDPVQSKLYRGFLNSNPTIAYKIIRNLPPNKKETVVLNSFLNAVRQISNNPKPFDKTLTGHPTEYSAKMRRMLSELQKGVAADPNFKGLVYSNYLESGIVPLSDKLKEAGITHGVYTGELDDKHKKALVDAYNSGGIKVLLVSGAGSEGLDLKGTKLIQVMEPHWNDARIEQLIGRGIRHKSHSHLPQEERKVRVQMFYSKPLPTFLERMGLGPVFKYLGGAEKEMGADVYMTNLAERKQKLVDEMFEILREVGSQPAVKRADFCNRKSAIYGLLKKAVADANEPYAFEDLTESELKAHKNILRKKIKDVGFSQAVGGLIALPFQLKDVLMQPLEMWQYKRLADRNIDPEVLSGMMSRATYDITPKWLYKQIGKHPGWVGLPAFLGYHWARMGATGLGTAVAGTAGRSVAEGKSLPWDVAKGMGVGGLASLAASSPWLGADIYKDYKILQGHRPNAWFDFMEEGSHGRMPKIYPSQKLTGPSHALLRKLLIKNTALKAAIYALPGLLAGGIGAGMGYTGKRGVKQEKNIRPLTPDVDPNQIRSSLIKNVLYGPDAMYIERMKQSLDRIGKRLAQVRKAREAEAKTIAARVRSEKSFQSKFTGAVVDDREKMKNMLLAMREEAETRLGQIEDTSGL